MAFRIAISTFIFLLASWGAQAESLPSSSDSQAGAAAQRQKWSLHVPSDGRVIYRGVASLDGAGSPQAGILYPAPNLGGFVAALITHGLINESIKQNQKDKLQSDADKVLTHYSKVIDSFSLEDLMRRALSFMTSELDVSLLLGNPKEGEKTGIESYPVFSLTQDQTAIILDNTIVIHAQGDVQENTYKNTVRIISRPNNRVDSSEYWTASDGENLKTESARLVAESFDIAFRDLSATLESGGETFRTIRYREGGTEKFERAKVVVNRCDRLVIRSLRGTLMSVPLSEVASQLAKAEKGCTP
jgi:hypothetical protein